jgi:hypothetical protein
MEISEVLKNVINRYISENLNTNLESFNIYVVQYRENVSKYKIIINSWDPNNKIIKSIYTVENISNIINIIRKELTEYSDKILFDVSFENKSGKIIGNEELSLTINISMLYNLPDDIWSIIMSKMDDIENIFKLATVYPALLNLTKSQQFFKSFVLSKFKGLNYFNNYDFRKNGTTINWERLSEELLALYKINPKEDGMELDVPFDKDDNIIFNTITLKLAIYYNFSNLVKFLILNPNIEVVIPEDVPETIRSPLAVASSRSENLDIFETIYNDPRIKQLDKLDDKVFVGAAMNLKNGSILAILMNDKRTSIQNINMGLLYCIINNNIDGFMTLTLYKYTNSEGIYVGVNLGDNNNLLLINASGHGNVEIVKYLIGNINVDPSAQQDMPLMVAIDNGKVEIVKILLNDPRINPSNNNNMAITLASQKFTETWEVIYAEIITMIRAHPMYIPVQGRILGFNIAI